MNEFIVVVEVDHVRALAAFSKGVSELELIWPQAMAHAEAVDAPWVKRQQDERAKLDELIAESAEYRTQLAARIEAEEVLRRWRAKPFYSRSSESAPALPPMPTKKHSWDEWEYKFPSPMCPHTLQTDVLKSILSALKRQRDLASVAVSAYRLMERDAIDMVEWESGAALERFKQQYLPKEPA